MIAFATAYYPLAKAQFKCSFCLLPFDFKQNRNRHQTSGRCAMFQAEKAKNKDVLTDQQRENEEKQRAKKK